MNKHQRVCEKCKRVFGTEKTNQKHCIPCQRNLHLYSMQQPNKTCKSCKEPFYTPNNAINCLCCTEKKYTDLDSARKQKQKETEEANLKWKENKEAKKRKGKSIQQLISESEYKRVFDDKGWDHYLKGRKYDKI